MVPGPFVDLTLGESGRLAEPRDLLLGPVGALLELNDEHLDLTFVLADSVLLAISLAEQLGIDIALASFAIEVDD